MENRYYSASDIAQICEVSKSRAYQLISQWNKELKSKGYTVPKAVHIVKRYANERLFLEVCE